MAFRLVKYEITLVLVDKITINISFVDKEKVVYYKQNIQLEYLRMEQKYT